MATTNYSSYNLKDLKAATKFKFAIVTAEWNERVTNNLQKGAYETLMHFGAKKTSVKNYQVPGAFELTFVAAKLVKSKKFDALIVLGCVIQGETKHFDFVCNSVTQGITALNINGTIPVVFGLLTDNTLKQSIDRSGGKLGNKGVECAITAIKMAQLNVLLSK